MLTANYEFPSDTTVVTIFSNICYTLHYIIEYNKKGCISFFVHLTVHREKVPYNKTN
jgi:hypothetical protein